MQPSIATELGWLSASSALTATLARGEGYAGAQQHRFVMLEHVLLSLTEDEDASAVLREAGIDVARLRDDAAAFLGRLNDRLMPGEGARPQVHPDLRRILEYAAQAAQKSRRPQINGAVVVAAIVGEGRSVAANILKSHGLTFQDAIRALQRQPPVQPPPAPPPPAMMPPAVALPYGGHGQQPMPYPAAPEPAPTGGGLQPLSASPFPLPSVVPFAPPPLPAPPPPSIGGLPVPQPLPGDGAQMVVEEPWIPHAPPPQEFSPPGPTATDIARETILAQARERVQSARPNAAVSRSAAPMPEAAPAPGPAAAAVHPAGVVLSPAAPSPAYAEPQGAQSGEHPAPGMTALPPGSQEQEGPVPAQPPPGGLAGMSPELAAFAIGDAEAAPDDGRGYPVEDRAGAPTSHSPAVPAPQGGPPPLSRVHPHHPLPPALPSGRAVRGAPIVWAEGTAAAGMRQPVRAPEAPPQASGSDPGTLLEPSQVQAPWPELAAPAAPGPQPRPDAAYDGNFAGAPYPAPEEVLASLGHAPQPRPRPPLQRRPSYPGGAPVAPEISAAEFSDSIPSVMRLAVPQTVEVRLTRPGAEAGRRQGPGAGAPFHHQVSITRTVAARLKAPNGGFAIEQLSPETQWVESRTGPMHDGITTWRWVVTPLKGGTGTLLLAVSSRAVDLDGVAAETALPDQVLEIKVRPNLALAARRAGGWLAALAIGVALGRFGGAIVDLVRRSIGL